MGYGYNWGYFDFGYPIVKLSVMISIILLLICTLANIDIASREMVQSLNLDFKGNL